MKWTLAFLFSLLCLQGQAQALHVSYDNADRDSLKSRSASLFMKVFKDPEAAEVECREFLTEMRARGEKLYEAQALRFLSTIWYRWTNYDSASAYLAEGKAIAEALGDTVELAEFANTEGSIFEETGHLDSAEQAYNKSLNLVGPMPASLNKTKIEARAFINLGNVNQTRGDLVTALEYLYKAQGLCERNNFVRYLPSIHYSISETQLALGEYQLANDELHRGLRFATRSQNKLHIARMQLMLGEIALHFHDLPEAECYYRESLDLARQIRNSTMQGRAGSGLTMVLLELGRLDAAQGQAQAAVDLLTASGDTAQLHAAFGALGEVLLAKGNFRDAAAACAHGRANATESQSMKGNIALCACLSRAYAGMGDHKAAYRYSQEQQALKDSLLSSENTRLMARQEAKYHYAHQRSTDSLANLQAAQLAQIALEQERERHRSSLTLSYALAGMGLILAFSAAVGFWVIRAKNKDLLFKNTRIAEQKDTIEQALQEKEVLLREVHHRVKNNLQVVSSLLELQARELKEPALKEVFNAAQLRVQAMGLIHRKLHQGNNFSELRMPNYVEQLANEIASLYPGRPVEIAVAVIDEPMNLDVSVVLGLILNELILNAFRHAFPDGKAGCISISLQRDTSLADTYVLSVADNGTGFPENFDLQRSPTLGLQLVAGLAKQIKGSLELRRGPNTCIVVQFKASK